MNVRQILYFHVNDADPGNEARRRFGLRLADAFSQAGGSFEYDGVHYGFEDYAIPVNPWGLRNVDAAGSPRIVSVDLPADFERGLYLGELREFARVHGVDAKLLGFGSFDVDIPDWTHHELVPDDDTSSDG